MNAIKNLSVNNFTAFREANFEFVPGINVLIGENSTGKTHILKLIYALIQICQQTVGKQEKEVHELLASTTLRAVFKSENTADLVRKTISQRSPEEKPSLVKLQFDDEYIHYHWASIAEIPSSEKFEWRTSALKNKPPQAILLPGRELLTIYPGFIATYQQREIPYDRTYFDLAIALNANPLRQEMYNKVKHLIEPLEKVIGSGERISKENDHFYLESSEGGKLEVNLIAEGHRKLSMLAYLVRNGSLTPESALLWDEPEANLNPKLVTVVVDFLLNLANAGAQIFIATHDYLLSYELSLRAEYGLNSNIRFFSLYRQEGEDGVLVESGNTLADLMNNPILDAFVEHNDRENALFYEAEPEVAG